MSAARRKRWLDAHRDLLNLVMSDLRRQGVTGTGRQGLPSEAVLRCALLKQYRQLSYEEWRFICKIPPRSGPLPGCHGDGA